jgi:hypothetical protein
MANAIYPKYKEVILGAATNTNLSSGTVKVALVTSTYTYSAAYQYLSSLTGTVGTAQIIPATKTITDGVFKTTGTNTFTAVASGSTVVALVLYVDTSVAGTSPLVAYLDTGVTGLPVTTNGGDITITWNASGIFAL